MKQRNIVIALLLGVLFVIAGVAAVGPNTAVFKAIIVQNDATVGNNVTVGGGVEVVGALEVTGNSIVSGAIYGKVPVLLKTASYAATAADTGAVINTTNAITVTLPAVAAGLNLCVFNGDGADIKIDPSTTNTVVTLTNGNGDRLTNTTVGDSVCLVGLSGTSWMALERVGTWSDGN